MKYFEPSISSLRLVAMIMQQGKLTSAAYELHMSQSAASHALKSLESQLGSQLFRRERDGLRLTEAGQRLCPLIEAALSSLDRIGAEAAGLPTLEAGSLRIAAVASLLGTILPSILREYANRYPGVELSIFEGTDDEVHAWIRSGVAHIGFAALPVDGVESEEIARDEWLALVRRRAYPANDGETDAYDSRDGGRRARGQPNSPPVFRRRLGLSRVAVEAASVPAYRHDPIYKLCANSCR